MLSRFPLWMVVLLVGCGSASSLKTVPVSGTINYKGAPVKDAHVTFATEKSPRTATGVTDSSGRFKLTTINANDGAVAGDHVITIVARPDPASAGSSMPMNAKPEDYLQAMAAQKGKKTMQPPGAGTVGKGIPAKYSDPTKSGLKRTVVAGEKNDFTIELVDD